MRRGLACLVFGVVGFAIAFGVPAGARTRHASQVDDLIASCPSAAEIAAIDAKVQISIEGDPTAGTSACGMTFLRLNAYNALRVMQQVQFVRALPWTQSSLWDWFTTSITAIRFRNDIGVSSCCSPANTINVQTQTLVAAQGRVTRWLDPTTGRGLGGLIGLLIHEARHNNQKPHTCNNVDDQTWAEQGAWAVENEADLWFGLYSTGSFLDGPDDTWPNQYRDGGLAIDGSRICSLAAADVSTASTVAPVSPLSGSRITVTSTVANGGPGAAEDIYFYDPVPVGTSLVAATPSQGSCSTVAPTRVVCELGPLAVGASVQVALQLDVTAPVGATIKAGGVFHQDSGPFATAVANEFLKQTNNEGPWSVTVAAPATTTQATTTVVQTTTQTTATTVTQTTPKPKPKPQAKKKPPKCKRGRHSTKKHPCRK